GPPPQANLTDSVESAGSGLRAKWASLEVPIQIGVVVGTVIVIAAFARFVLPAMLAAIGVGAVIAVLFIPYWLPTIVAFFRGHPNKAVIALVNFFFGWTFIGWFISLFWALTDPVVAGGQPVIVTVNNTANAGGATVSQNQPGPPNTPQQYRVGDVVNGHRFDGANWVPEGGTYQAPPPPPQ
ncbi:MAG: superinfection immunity protein, partial [Actinomycetota bacterium]